MDRHGVEILNVIFLFEEELEKLSCLFGILPVLEDHPRLGIDLGSSLLPGRPMGLHQYPEVLGIGHVFGGVLLDIARSSTITLVEDGSLTGGQVGEGIQVPMAQPARRQDRDAEFFIEIQHFY